MKLERAEGKIVMESIPMQKSVMQKRYMKAVRRDRRPFYESVEIKANDLNHYGSERGSTFSALYLDNGSN